MGLTRMGDCVKVLPGVKMGKLILEIKRPDAATPERALELFNKGVTAAEMAAMWGISRGYIYYILHKAGWKPGKPQ